jgi:hypothetical protein
MMPIDKFINQLIQLGLADSFLDVINNHYLKVIEVYNIISFIDEDNIADILCSTDDNIDLLKVLILLIEPVELENRTEKSNEFVVDVINNGCSIEITVINNFESEEAIYENRFNGRGTPYTHKWS